MAPMIVAVTSTPTQIVTAPHGQTTHQGENSGEVDTTDPFVGMENRDLEYTGKHHRLGVEVVQRGGGLNDVGIGSDLGGFYGESSVPEQAGGVMYVLSFSLLFTILSI